MTSTPSPACCSLCEPLASFGPEEEDDDMPSSLTPACSICGLRFTSRPLLELHIREDHLQPDRPAGPGHGDPAGGRASQPPAGGPARRHRQLARPPRITKEVTTMTSTRRPRRPLTGSVMAALRRARRPGRSRGGQDPARQPGDSPTENRDFLSHGHGKGAELLTTVI